MADSTREKIQSDSFKRKVGMWALLLGIACMGSGQTMVFAILPPLARQLDLLDIQVGTIFTLSAIFFSLLGPFMFVSLLGAVMCLPFWRSQKI